MAKFVKLTLMSGTPIYINMDLVSDMYSDGFRTEISLLTSYVEDCLDEDRENHFHVKETPEEILEIMNR